MLVKAPSLDVGCSSGLFESKLCVRQVNRRIHRRVDYSNVSGMNEYKDFVVMLRFKINVRLIDGAL